ncbi:hypothetical protein D0Z00_004109 [Geotrichum galactomycetum]|uniref:Uncharacterized protein n=1 Tax=Geotrichum galactomycetum TaxID=27317 RepID=A0ACB6UZG6_9ASCO|nr:hypothetical protein D0Z00_004109 [Geotrichum candidum]
MHKRSRPHNAHNNYPAGKRHKQSREDKQSRQWVAGEDNFVLNQRKHGSVIRVSQNRANPIDLLVVNLRLWEGDRSSEFDQIVDLEVPLPVDVIARLDAQQVEELLDAVDEYLDLDTNPRPARYWRDVRTLCKELRRKLRETSRNNQAHEAADAAIAADIDSILKGKTYDQLLELEDQIRKTLKSKDGPVDVDFWSEVLDELLIAKATTRLAEFQDDVVTERCKRLDLAQAAAAQRERQNILKQLAQRETPITQDPIPYDPAMDTIPNLDLIYKQNLNLYSPDQYLATMTSTRQRVLAQKFVPMNHAEDMPKFVPSVINLNQPGDQATKTTTDLSQSLYEKEMARATEENEENFVSEASVPGLLNPTAGVKPRYFNRVMLGYEWTKYNQQHYTAENPPRKMARGYKFNIFYPDLTNASETPVYKIIRDEAGKDPKLREQLGAGESNTCIILFHAQPPYQDIAFRIVDRPWDSSTHKNAGFKSRFENGVLQLHFRFKRVFYRK